MPTFFAATYWLFNLHDEKYPAPEVKFLHVAGFKFREWMDVGYQRKQLSMHQSIRKWQIMETFVF